MRKLLTGLSAAALTLAGLALATPAHAAVVPEELGFVDTQTCEDVGGVPYTVSIDWDFKYDDPAGTRRVSVNPLKIVRDDGEAGAAADAGVDLHFDVSSHGTVRWTQHKVYSGLDLDAGTDDTLYLNPRNPVSNANDTFIRVSVGTDGDGLGNCPWLTFVQPAGIGLRV